MSRLNAVRWCWVTCMFLCCGSIHVVVAGQGEVAMERFEQKQYEEALRIWSAMVEDGKTGAAIFYNIGLAQSRLGHTAAAIQAFEQAQRFKPGQRKIRLALEAERKNIENSTIPVPSFFLSDWYRCVLALFRPGHWALIGLLALGMVVLDRMTAGKTILHRVSDNRLKNIVAASVGFLCLCLATLRYYEIYRTDESIIISSCDIRQAPSDESPLTRVLHPGEKVKTLDQIGEWHRISMLNLDEGWIKRDCMAPLMPSVVSPGNH